jgi:hypothetical protein
MGWDPRHPHVPASSQAWGAVPASVACGVVCSPRSRLGPYTGSIHGPGHTKQVLDDPRVPRTHPGVSKADQSWDQSWPLSEAGGGSMCVRGCLPKEFPRTLSEIHRSHPARVNSKFPNVRLAIRLAHRCFRSTTKDDKFDPWSSKTSPMCIT